MKNMPLVSVVLPCYNCEKYVKKAVLSIINQTYKNIEIIITDDCSTDSSFEILQGLALIDSRIKLIRNIENLKLITTLNNSIELANGKYIARMDADDISLPVRIEKQVDFMEGHPDYVICGTNAWHIDSHDKIITESLLPENNSLLVAVLGTKNKKISWIHCNPESLLKSKSFFLYSFLLTRCDVVVCLCEQQKHNLVRIMNKKIDSEKIVICNNLVNKKEVLKLKEELLDISDYFLMVARLDYRTKDFTTMIDAYSNLDKKIIDKYCLVILGDGPDREAIKKYISKKTISGKIILFGNDINPYKWMSKAKLFIQSSKSEGFSLVILEALLCGAVVISSDCPVGPKEILDNGRYGKLFEVGNVSMLCSQITELLENQGLYNQFASNAFKRAEMVIENAEQTIIKVLKGNNE